MSKKINTISDCVRYVLPVIYWANNLVYDNIIWVWWYSPVSLINDSYEKPLVTEKISYPVTKFFFRNRQELLVP